jgi:hypothetical protein
MDDARQTFNDGDPQNPCSRVKRWWSGWPCLPLWPDNNFDLPVLQWVKLDIDKPLIALQLTDHKGTILVLPKRPDPRHNDGSFVEEGACQKAQAGQPIMLPIPGEWWLYANLDPALNPGVTSIGISMIDAAHPNFALIGAVRNLITYDPTAPNVQKSVKGTNEWTNAVYVTDRGGGILYNGDPVTYAPVTVTDASAVVLASGSTRLCAEFFNMDEDNYIFIRRDGGAASDLDWPIPPLSPYQIDGRNPHLGNVTAACASGVTAQLRIHETIQRTNP